MSQGPASGRSSSRSTRLCPDRVRATAPAPRRRSACAGSCRRRLPCSTSAAASAGRRSISPSCCPARSSRPSTATRRASSGCGRRSPSAGSRSGCDPWSATWRSPSCHPRASISSGPRGRSTTSASRTPCGSATGCCARRLPRLHRRGLAQGEPTARGQGELRPRLPDHGHGPRRPRSHRQDRLLARRPLHPAGRGLVGRLLHADGATHRGAARQVRRRCRGARRARPDSRRSPRCTGGTRTTTPTSSSWRDALSESPRRDPDGRDGLPPTGGVPRRTHRRPISEFSLSLATLGLSLGHIDSATVRPITVVGLITIGLSTYLILYPLPPL